LQEPRSPQLDNTQGDQYDGLQAIANDQVPNTGSRVKAERLGENGEYPLGQVELRRNLIFQEMSVDIWKKPLQEDAVLKCMKLEKRKTIAEQEVCPVLDHHLHEQEKCILWSVWHSSSDK